MITASSLAGFFAAHAVSSLAEGNGFIPIFAYTTDDGGRKMERLVANDDLEAVVGFGKQRLQSNEMDANDAVLIYDGRIVTGEEELDAIVVEVRAYFSPQSEVVIAVPYTPKGLGGLRVHNLQILVWENCDDFEIRDVVEAFFSGIEANEAGMRAWDDALDESK